MSFRREFLIFLDNDILEEMNTFKEFINDGSLEGFELS
jgi:hypothetical protein